MNNDLKSLTKYSSLYLDNSEDWGVIVDWCFFFREANMLRTIPPISSESLTTFVSSSGHLNQGVDICRHIYMSSALLSIVTPEFELLLFSISFQLLTSLLWISTPPWMIAARTKSAQIYGHYSEPLKATDYYSLKLLFKVVANVGFYCWPPSFERLKHGFFHWLFLVGAVICYLCFLSIALHWCIQASWRRQLIIPVKGSQVVKCSYKRVGSI